MRYETLLLDFHGTFTSNRGRLAHSLNGAYQETLGRKIPKVDFQAILDRDEGISVSNALKSHLNGNLSDDKKSQLVDAYHAIANEIYVPKYRFLIRQLHAMGVLCAVVTNGNEQIVRDTLAKWGIDQYILEVYGKGRGSLLEGVPKKPSTDVIEFVIKDLRSRGLPVRREAILMVGDYQDDIGAGNNAGIHTAFLVTGPNQLPEYYQVRPTYALLDTSVGQVRSAWLQGENVYTMRDLPKIVAG